MASQRALHWADRTEVVISSHHLNFWPYNIHILLQVLEMQLAPVPVDRRYDFITTAKQKVCFLHFDGSVQCHEHALPQDNVDCLFAITPASRW